MQKERGDTKILLVSDNKADVGNIKMRLEEAINIPCRIWHCDALAEAMGYLNENKSLPDIIILDLGLTDDASPKEIYEKIGTAADGIPIIVVTGTGEKEHRLATFVMEAGASDHMIRGQFWRLADAIEFSLIRRRIALRASDEHAENLESSQNDHDGEMKRAGRKSDKKIREKNQYISWVMGGYSVEENHKKEAGA